MRVLWFSNAPWTPTGYGNQTRLVCANLPALGYELAVAANWGLKGSKFEVGGIRVYPGGRGAFSNDAVNAYAADWEADVVITLYDVWPLNFADMPNFQRPWIAWAPIDHEQVPPAVIEPLRKATGVVAFSEHGQATLKREDFNPAFIPLGVDTRAFTPGDQLEARKHIGFSEDAGFIIGMVAVNSYFPSRKAIPQVLSAFSRFLAEVDDKAYLYLHMVADSIKKGLEVELIAESLGIRDRVIFCDPFWYLLGFPNDYMVNLYRSLDVLVNPSLGEGFGIPIIESMACGTPVIGANNTSMPELIRDSGWLVEGDPWWSSQDAWQMMPSVKDILRCMTEAYEQWQHYSRFGSGAWKDRRMRCRAIADNYNFEDRVSPAWDAYLKGRMWQEAADD